MHRVVLGTRNGGLRVTSGVTCVAGGSTVNGGVVVREGASLVVADGARINGGLNAGGAAVVHVFGAQVRGDARIAGSDDVIVAGSFFSESLVLAGNRSPDVTIPSGDTRNYGVGVVGNVIGGNLACDGNDPGVTSFGAPNAVAGVKSGQCAAV